MRRPKQINKDNAYYLKKPEIRLHDTCYSFLASSAATESYEAEYQVRTEGLDPMEVTDTMSDMPSMEDRNLSSQFKKFREYYVNQDGQSFGTSKRMLK